MIRNFIIFILIVAVIGTLSTVVIITKQRQAREELINKMDLAEAMIDSEDYNSAIKNLLPVVKWGKRFERADKALYLLAKAYEGIQAPEANDLWQRIVDDFPDSEYRYEALLKLARSSVNEDEEKARDYFEKVKQNAGPPLRDQALLGIAQTYIDEDVEKARELFYGIIESVTDTQVVAQAKDFLSKVNTERLWSPVLDEFCKLYRVQPGDSNAKIGQMFKTTAWFIGEANDVKPNQLRPGQTLKVPKEPFRIVIDKSNCRLNLLTESGKFVKWYPVGIGEQSYKTPANEYFINTKEINPTWFRPEGGVIQPGDPENALGSRWMGIRTEEREHTGLGIHGTNAPETIGYRKSAGCIRMYNEDVEELYKIVTYGTKVTIVEDMENSDS